ncbi:hypothetical protein AWJ20_1826 [Sugiyamaella lignohabitans]|uniref:Uncharacterized protein n=1 Tax=Sugiyamaella lignohabitans TaxID=796027 RepID=A0A167E1C9_9ASCO|nr:uncharacterized protein AWJ20_1826 [Sugiyamaella lignohabitans]ANB13530.1 hypothetical protein AWJ20_1826 [Sugiyamaella lignohabitans]
MADTAIMESIELSQRKRTATPASPTLPTSSSDWSGQSTSLLEENLVLDHGHTDEATSLSLSQLSPVDRKNFFILTLLYLLQGIPVGLAFGSIPYLLKSNLSYTQIGVFSFASYPYSLKVLWSPVVDAIYSRSFGRRKSWIVPIQFVSAFVLIILGSVIEPYMEDAENQLITITFFFFILVFLCATQDIAVDGWGLTLLTHAALPYASTAQTIGLNTGYFTSFTVFLAFNSPDFANKYFRVVPSDDGLVSLSGYLKFWGVVYLITTTLVGLFKTEEKSKSDGDGGIASVYKTMFQVLKLKNIQILIFIHLIAKIGFQASEGATNLKLLDKGLSKEDLALTVLIDFPFEIIFGYYAAKWSTGKDPLQPWILAYLARLGCALLSMFLVMLFPSDGAGSGYLLMIIIVHVLGSFASTIQFVSINAFHTQIADPIIGGTYMTILNTICNLGGQWPKIIVLSGIDWYTEATCSAVSAATGDVETFSCASNAGKKQCTDIGGQCNISKDGYYVMNVLCILVGLTLFFGYIKSRMQQLQRLPLSSWRVD